MPAITAGVLVCNGGSCRAPAVPQAGLALQRPQEVDGHSAGRAGTGPPTRQSWPPYCTRGERKSTRSRPPTPHRPPTSQAYLDFGEGFGDRLGGRLVPPRQRGAEPLDLTEVDEEGALGAVHPKEGVARVRGPACAHPL